MSYTWTNDENRIFGPLETNFPEEETEERSREFARRWMRGGSGLLTRDVGDWMDLVARQENPERRRIWGEVLDECIASGTLALRNTPPRPTKPTEPPEMLQFDDVAV